MTHAENCTWRSGGWMALGECNCGVDTMLDQAAARGALAGLVVGFMLGVGITLTACVVFGP